MSTTQKKLRKQYLTRLIAISRMGKGRSPFIVSDLVDQDDLFTIQDLLSQLMLDMAGGDPELTGMLTKHLPYVFKAVAWTNGD